MKDLALSLLGLGLLLWCGFHPWLRNFLMPKKKKEKKKAGEDVSITVETE